MSDHKLTEADPEARARTYGQFAIRDIFRFVRIAIHEVAARIVQEPSVDGAMAVHRVADNDRKIECSSNKTS